MFKKILFSILIALASVFITPRLINADGEFVTDVNVNYSIDEQGKTLVTNNITLENVFSDFYATSYSLVLHNINITNQKALRQLVVEALAILQLVTTI
ncbi:hypothetical protein HY045_00650 [Candidatus Woesebacteria bacterium]|nr:hypothetical protein [Candidatus Woesebacteria bacterium]